MAAKHGKAGIRYARALLAALVSDASSRDSSLVDEGALRDRLFNVLENLSAIDSALLSNHEARTIFMNPMIEDSKKESLINSMLSSSTDVIFASFLRTVFANGRISILPEITKNFKALLYQKLKMVSVKVATARDMDEDERAFIVSSLRSQIMGEPELLWTVEPELIGGIVVEYDGYKMDASVKGALSKAERELLFSF